MYKIFSISGFFIFNSFLILTTLNAQSVNDLKRSVPVWFTYDGNNNKAVLRWINDPAAVSYTVGEVKYQTNPTFSFIGNVGSNIDSFVVPSFETGKRYNYRLTKTTGAGFIDFGIQQPMVHQRGRCLVLVDSRFAGDLEFEINRWVRDIEGDGWTVDTLEIDKNLLPPMVKEKILSWYKSNYTLSQSVILMGNIAVPYAGTTAIDGHPDHAGAWASDVYYGDVNGNWTDNSVNNIAATREENRNAPGDGKFDQTVIPSDIELEIGRIDFSKLPAFTTSELELMRLYLNKNHTWRRGMNPYPNKALIENNFASFEEGFGQNGWRNFLPMFGKENVASGDYDNQLVNDKHVFSYACGGGSYTSCGGIGTTQNLWVAKSMQTVFTMNFGSYFGDWDSQNNFLRSALASGDILVNMWAGRPNWFLTSMASGNHIGNCAKLTQNASNAFFFTGNGARYTHVALLGDPTLRLHPLKSVTNVSAELVNGAVHLNWEKGDENQNLFAVYRLDDDGTPFLLSMVEGETEYAVNCLIPGKEYHFMIKSAALMETGSGSYYNSGIGEKVSIFVDNSNIPLADFEFSAYYERIKFVNLSTQSNVYEWEFGDGNLSSEVDPNHVYNAGGTYEVCLIAKNEVCPNVTKCTSLDIESSLPTDLIMEITQPTCYGFENGSILIEVVGGESTELEYLWNNGNLEKDLLSVGAGSYTLDVKSKITGNVLSRQTVMGEPDSLNVTVTTTPSTGEDGTVAFMISGGLPPYSFLWTDPQVDWSKLAPGVYGVTITDSNGCSKAVSFVIELRTGTVNPKTDINLFPNPVSHFLHISLVEEFDYLVIADVQGELIYKQAVIGKNTISIDCKDFVSGNYVLLLFGKQNKKVVKMFTVVATR